MKKFLLSLFSASAMICNAQSQTPDHTPYKWIGDVNGDGYVNVADNTYLSNIILTNTFDEVGYVGKDVYTKDEVNAIVGQLISRIEALEAKHKDTPTEEPKTTYTINGVEYPMPEPIDFNLPSGTKWANATLGNHMEFIWDGTLDENAEIVYPEENDVAKLYLGEHWRLPTKAELEEVLEHLSFNYVWGEHSYAGIEATIMYINGIETDLFWGTFWGKDGQFSKPNKSGYINLEGSYLTIIYGLGDECYGTGYTSWKNKNFILPVYVE